MNLWIWDFIYEITNHQQHFELLRNQNILSFFKATHAWLPYSEPCIEQLYCQSIFFLFRVYILPGSIPLCDVFCNDTLVMELTVTMVLPVHRTVE